MGYVPRSQWAGGPSKADRRPRKVKGCAVHWPGGRGYRVSSHAQCLALVASIRNMHVKSRGYSDIAYNELVCQHGHIIEGRGLDRVSAANGDRQAGEDYGSVCALLDMDDDPSPEMLRGLAESIRRQGGAATTHNAVRRRYTGSGTECPGAKLTAWVEAGARPPAENKPTDEEDDMPFSEADLRRIVREESRRGVWEDERVQDSRVPAWPMRAMPVSGYVEVRTVHGLVREIARRVGLSDSDVDRIGVEVREALAESDAPQGGAA